MLPAKHKAIPVTSTARTAASCWKKVKLQRNFHIPGKKPRQFRKQPVQKQGKKFIPAPPATGPKQNRSRQPDINGAVGKSCLTQQFSRKKNRREPVMSAVLHRADSMEANSNL